MRHHTPLTWLLRIVQQANAKELITDLQGQVALNDERVASAINDRNEALEKQKETQKELDLKVFALKRSQKVGAFERKTNEGMMKKHTIMKDELAKERRDHEFTQKIRADIEDELEKQRHEANRERELRLLGMHRHQVRQRAPCPIPGTNPKCSIAFCFALQLVIREDSEKLKKLQHLPKVLDDTRSHLKIAKEDNTILQTALGVEKGVQEAMDDYMDEAAQEIKSLRAKYVEMRWYLALFLCPCDRLPTTFVPSPALDSPYLLFV